jgi:hypothetical protein
MVSVQPWLGGVSILVSLSLDESESHAGVTIARLPDNRFRDTPLLQQVA